MEWIRAEDRLPEEHRWVWVLDAFGEVNPDQRVGGRYDWRNGSWVTHWCDMVPPEPPSEAVAENEANFEKFIEATPPTTEDVPLEVE
jgi:hypothetical protein